MSESSTKETTLLRNLWDERTAASLAEARRIIESSFPVDRFEPAAVDRWSAEYRRFQDYVELTCV